MEANELVKRIESKSAPSVIDARTKIEFELGHVPGAIHAPSLKILLNAAHLPKDKNHELVIYCTHGGRAMIAQKLLARKGYSKMDLLKGHWKFWKNSGLPVEK